MNPHKTVCFSGHRPEKFRFPLTEEYPEYVRLLQTTREAILKAIDDGYEKFMVGMAGGFDLIAASMFYELKDAVYIPENIRFTAVLPFRPSADQRMGGFTPGGAGKKLMKSSLWRLNCRSLDLV